MAEARNHLQNSLSAVPSVRLKVALRGAVQGVGFRPFVHRLAAEMGLKGTVHNSSQGVFIEAEGSRAALEEFILRLQSEKPAMSFIQGLETRWLDAVGFETFEICASENGGQKLAHVLPDIATCPECLREIFNPQDRRFGYPFTNCTNCGPRFTIIEALPYDRRNTSMKEFAMCPKCQAEYDDPRNRRFHAQPNACPICGPQLQFWDGCGAPIARANADALKASVDAIRAGKIVAVKGLGGFHLMVDARNEAGVKQLRERKHREEKPFALMFPSLDQARQGCNISLLEERLLLSPAAPIVLLSKNGDQQSPIVNALAAPGNPNLGVMLPSNPIHHLLMAELGFPVVATSGNLSDEPICTDELEAVKRLEGIADCFLVHNRPIMRHVDDSIVRVVLNREMVLRRARGYAPLPVKMRSAEGRNGGETVLCVGAHLKNAVALAVGGNVFISQHIGDLETVEAERAFRRVITDFQKLYDAQPDVVVADLHPDYISTKFATDYVSSRAGGVRLFQVQHHVAHVLSCIAENETPLPALGVAWDGTGYGTDGTIWGGEFFLVTEEAVERVATLRSFPLPGGDAGVKEPRRAALGMLHEMRGSSAFERRELSSIAAFLPQELSPLRTMLERGINCPRTSSVGRLFDAVASILNVRQDMRFEGQAAMELEFALASANTKECYELPLRQRDNLWVLDWEPAVTEILRDIGQGTPTADISAKFHNTLAESVVTVARRLNQPRVVLSGGCFQNRYLLERTVTGLQSEGFRPYWHQRVPPNDGGIALGQAMAAMREFSSSLLRAEKS